MTDNIHSCSPFCTLPAFVKEGKRREFEQHIRDSIESEVGVEFALQKDIDGNYYTAWVSHRWVGWQAATERATAQWQPIETAPKDGTFILVFNKQRIFEAWYVAQWDRFLVSETGGTNHINPSHWMPLPPPPAIRQGGAA